MKPARMIRLLIVTLCWPAAILVHAADSGDVQALIRQLEHTRLKALIEADITTAAPIHAEDFQLINPFGGTASKREYLEAVRSRTIDYVLWEPVEPIEVHAGKDWAALRYRAKIEVVVNSTPLPPTHLWHTDLYLLRQGRWEIVWSQATEIKPPVIASPRSQ